MEISSSSSNDKGSTHGLRLNRKLRLLSVAREAIHALLGVVKDPRWSMICRHEPKRILSRDKDARVALKIGKGDELAPGWWQLVVACSALGSSREGKAARCYLDETDAERGLSRAAAGG